ncbi:hypothetical protein ACIRU3_31405 [Streptomyces sp. NPDC101151]|uniref:hypothetical protein n=1 Tax=Streptomyces sp. NPDC101151 TaxID=3366115 RepID=UPI0037F9F72B
MTLALVGPMVVEHCAICVPTEATMALRSFGKDPETNGDHCPTVWLDEEKQEFVFQGWKADEALQAQCLVTGPIPDTEAVIRLPARMAQQIREALDAADGSAVR